MTAKLDDLKIVAPEGFDPGHDWSKALRSPGSMNVDFKEGMLFALETYCPASDGFSAARFEEEVLLTSDGCKVITLFPAEELPVADPY